MNGHEKSVACALVFSEGAATVGYTRGSVHPLIFWGRLQAVCLLEDSTYIKMQEAGTEGVRKKTLGRRW
jgi:hypothetical protein